MWPLFTAVVIKKRTTLKQGETSQLIKLQEQSPQKQWVL
jgi:hypothetical protein